MAIPWATILPFLISAGTSVASAKLGSGAAKQAAETQTEAAKEAAQLQRQTAQEILDLQRQIFNLQSQLAYPRYAAGTAGLKQLTSGMGLKVPESTFQIPEKPYQLQAPSVPGAGAALPGAGGGDLSQALLSATAKGPKGTLPGTVAKSALGFMIGGPAGAATLGLTGLIGRGRKQADQIVPYQNALTTEIGNIINQIKAKEASGTLTPQDWQGAIEKATQLRDQFLELTQKFGRAGPGAQQTIGSWLDPMLSEWGGYAEGRMHGGPIMGMDMMRKKYLVGEKGPEILEMMPGSEGWVYPNTSFRRMMMGNRAMPMMEGRQEGGPVQSNDPWANTPFSPAQIAAFKLLGMQQPPASSGLSLPPGAERWLQPGTQLTEAQRIGLTASHLGVPTDLSAPAQPRPGGTMYDPMGQQQQARPSDGFQPVNMPIPEVMPRPVPTPITGIPGRRPGVLPPGQGRFNTPIRRQGPAFNPFAWGNSPYQGWGSNWQAPQAGPRRNPSLWSGNRYLIPRQAGGPVFGIRDLQRRRNYAERPDLETSDVQFPQAPPAALPSAANDADAAFFSRQTPEEQARIRRESLQQWYEGHPEQVVSPEDRIAMGLEPGEGDITFGELMEKWKKPFEFDPEKQGLKPFNQQFQFTPPEGMPWNEAFAYDPAGRGFQPFNERFQFNTEDLYKDPGYLFRKAEGEKGLERAQSARGIVLSGRALKEMDRWNQGLASEEYGKAYGRALGEFGLGYQQAVDDYNRAVQVYGINSQQAKEAYQRALGEFGIGQQQTSDAYERARNEYDLERDVFETGQAKRFNRLSQIAGLGTGAAGDISGAASEFGAGAGGTTGTLATQLAGLLTDTGAAQAAGGVGSAQAWANMLSQLGFTAQQIQVLAQLRGLLGQQGQQATP